MPNSFNPHVFGVASPFKNDVDISGMVPLDSSFRPSDNDVICARGKEVYNHEGNRRFRELVKSYLPTYSKCVTKMQKTRLVGSIIDTVRQRSRHGGFVKNVDGKWYEVGDRRAKEKTGQTMRDLLHTRYSSSTKAKARARQQLREEHQIIHQTSQMLGYDETPQFLIQRPPERELFGQHQQQATNKSISTPWARDADRCVRPIRGSFQFPLADEIFSKGDEESEVVKTTLDFEPLPMEASIFNVDLDAKLAGGGLMRTEVSEESFHKAMDSLFKCLAFEVEGHLTGDNDTFPGMVTVQQKKSQGGY